MLYYLPNGYLRILRSPTAPLPSPTAAASHPFSLLAKRSLRGTFPPGSFSNSWGNRLANAQGPPNATSVSSVLCFFRRTRLRFSSRPADDCRSGRAARSPRARLRVVPPTPAPNRASQQCQRPSSQTQAFRSPFAASSPLPSSQLLSSLAASTIVLGGAVHRDGGSQ